jgi:hypothetical protein
MEFTLPFESGAKTIRGYINDNSNCGIKDLANYPIIDLPMLHEDALYILKFILVNEHLSKKKVIFKSGTRVNDKNTWKNTGLWFVLSCNDGDALENAVKDVKETVYWKDEKGEKQFIFNYSRYENECTITIYAEK